MLGASGYVGYGLETVEGTFVAPTIFLPVSSFDFSDTANIIEPDEIRYSRVRTVGLPSATSTSGTMALDLGPLGVAALLKSAWASGGGGTVTTAYAGGGNKHVFTPGKISPTYTFEASAADILIRRYGGIRVNTLEISSAFDQIVTSNWGLEGTTRGTTASPATPAFGAADPFHFTGASVHRDGVDISNIKSFTFTTGNNIDRIGTLRKTASWRRTALGMFDVSLTATMDFSDASDYALFLAGTEFAVKIHLEGAVFTGSNKYTLQIDIPRVRWNMIGVPITTTSLIEQSAEATILAPRDGTTPIFTGTLVNSEASVIGG